MNTTFTASQTRANIYNMLDQVKDNLAQFVISHKGIPTAALIPLEELESWQETLEIMSDQKLMKQIKQGEKDIKLGKTIPMDKVIKELGLWK